jgi:hypothetical protein
MYPKQAEGLPSLTARGRNEHDFVKCSYGMISEKNDQDTGLENARAKGNFRFLKRLDRRTQSIWWKTSGWW